jgi:amino acid transporter
VPAVLALVIVFLISLRGLNLSVTFNNILAVINILLLVIITLGGFIYGSFSNLVQTPYQNGFQGIIQSASIVIYAVTG